MPSCNYTAVLLMILPLFYPISTIAHPHHHQCSMHFHRKVFQRNMTNCKKLQTLGAEFGWNHHNGSVVDICIGASQQSETGWLAWGLNPLNQAQMIGTRALIGIRQPNGSLAINTYNVTWETKLGCGLRPSEIDVGVRDVKFEYVGAFKYYSICATLIIPKIYNTMRLNHVWQVGHEANGVEPLKHQTTLENVDSTETVNLASGRSHSNGVYRHNLRTVHGLLNIVGWGTLLPVGVIIARYFRRFPIEYPFWFQAHVSCQLTGYVLGTTGWIIGLYLGKTSKPYSFPIHALISHFLFVFATLQMLAIRLKPKAMDEYIRYWAMYHHLLGCALLAVIIVNIFRGIGIFTPNHTWKRGYIGLLGALALITLALEIFTWAKFMKGTDGTDPNRNGNKNKIGTNSSPQTQEVPQL
ncbi:cytochrome b561 and DOMON domain-containing protein At4g12980-like [Actinidia eriantha]|uniref:cytochrome b561 and DOMON domain-containing protein At4g12980-like n=1 Tax=Actinidia eriantha TaxID=165200 RepID=UPI002590F1CA|nr:cytochrome b561 and DOMON domain-containing protein At4g12980-like [Actinidia eriantha]